MKRLSTIAVAFLLVGCIGREPVTPEGVENAPSSTESDTPTQRLQPMTVVGYTASELADELERGRAELLAENYAEAATIFDRLRQLANDPAIASLAAYDAGLAHQHLGDHALAVTRFREVVDKYPESAVVRHAWVRVARNLGYLERWAEMERASASLLELPELPVMDAIEGHGGVALARVAQGDAAGAKIAVGKAQALIDKHGFGRSGMPPVQLAQVAFARGEILRLESERIALTPVPPNFGAVLEARCQGLLDAQSAYTEAMRSKDAHWSAMSGYRVGELYQRLHREAMEIPPPKNASLEQQRLFTAAMRLRYRILLEKGLTMMAGTVRLAERTGQESPWTDRARQAKAALEQSLEDETKALAATPYTEEEVRAALEKLKGTPPKKP